MVRNPEIIVALSIFPSFPTLKFPSCSGSVAHNPRLRHHCPLLSSLQVSPPAGVMGSRKMDQFPC